MKRRKRVPEFVQDNPAMEAWYDRTPKSVMAAMVYYLAQRSPTETNEAMQKAEIGAREEIGELYGGRQGGK